MMIKSATALRNDYDGMVHLSKSKQEPIFLTRNGEGEMVFLPIELWEKREAELNLLAELLRREGVPMKDPSHVDLKRCRWEC